MANPIFIPIAFAANGIKNPIQKVRQVGQDPEDFTWNEGAPLITMTKIEDGGKAPKGQDVNGVFNALSEHVIYGQNGNRYAWSQDVVDEFGGYALGAIVQSNDTTKEFRSLVANNTVNPNNGLGGVWEIYSGQGSIPTATSTTAGVTKVLNVLNSNDVGSALSAAQGKSLNDIFLKFTSSLGTTGEVKIPFGDSNLIIKWGKTPNQDISSSGSPVSVSFATAFPNACLNLQLTPDATGGSNPNAFASVLTKSRTGFTAYLYEYTPTTQNVGISWLAIGY